MIFLLLLTRVTVLAHVMVLTCNMALISVMVLTNAMVSTSAMVLTHVMVLPVLWCYLCYRLILDYVGTFFAFFIDIFYLSSLNSL